MWLTIQIAAGIVLAYVIIRNGAAVWPYSLGALAIAAIVGTIMIAAAFAQDTAQQYGGVGAILATSLRYAGIVLAVLTYIMGLVFTGFSLGELYKRVSGREIKFETALLFFAVFNFFLSMLALQGFNLFDEGPVMRELRRIGNAYGLADGLQVGAAFLLSLWPIALERYLARRGSKRVALEAQPEPQDQEPVSN